jgi:hypothetical protein
MDLDDFMKKKPAKGGESTGGNASGDDFGSVSFGGLDDPQPGQDAFGGLDDPQPGQDAFGGLDDPMPAQPASADPGGFDFNPPPADDTFPAPGEFPSAEEYEGMEDKPEQYHRPLGGGGGGFFSYFKLGARMALLKKDAVDDVASDPDSFVPALVIYLLPSVIIGILLFVFVGLMAGAAGGAVPPEFAMVMPFIQKMSFGLLIFPPLMAVLGSLVMVGILHLFARLMKGEGRFLDYYQTVGVGSLVTWGGALPFVGMLFSLWMIPVLVVITSRVHNLGAGKSVAVVLLPLVVMVILAIALISMLGMAAFMGGGQV